MDGNRAAFTIIWKSNFRLLWSVLIYYAYRAALCLIYTCSGTNCGALFYRYTLHFTVAGSKVIKVILKKKTQ